MPPPAVQPVASKLLLLLVAAVVNPGPKLFWLKIISTAPCVQAALADHATFMLDGWTSYEGPLNAEGRPETNYPWNQQLSDERVTVIATLLVDDLGVPRSDITRMSGHGNLDQPDPGQPRSAANRVVTITYTTKATS